MAERMTVQAKLEMGMRFDVEAGSGHYVTLDAAEHSGGQDAGFRPMTHTFRIVEAGKTLAVGSATPSDITVATM